MKEYTEGQVYSIRLRAAELAAINRWVARTRRKASDFIHEAIAQHTARQQLPEVQVSAPAGFRFYLYGVQPEANVTSGGPTIHYGDETTST